jgi:hypothetical protein
VCTRGSNRAPARGPSTSPLDAMIMRDPPSLRLTWPRFAVVALILAAILGGVTYLSGRPFLRVPMSFACLSILAYLAFRFHAMRRQLSTGEVSSDELKRDLVERFLGPRRSRMIWLIVTTTIFVVLVILQPEAPR